MKTEKRDRGKKDFFFFYKRSGYDDSPRVPSGGTLEANFAKFLLSAWRRMGGNPLRKREEGVEWMRMTQGWQLEPWGYKGAVPILGTLRWREVQGGGRQGSLDRLTCVAPSSHSRSVPHLDKQGRRGGKKLGSNTHTERFHRQVKCGGGEEDKGISSRPVEKLHIVLHKLILIGNFPLWISRKGFLIDYQAHIDNTCMPFHSWTKAQFCEYGQRCSMLAAEIKILRSYEGQTVEFRNPSV